MPYGTPDLPRTLEAVIAALPSYFRPTAAMELMRAAYPKEYAKTFERWWKVASQSPTSEQLKDPAVLGEVVDPPARYYEAVAAFEALPAEEREAKTQALLKEQERQDQKRTEASAGFIAMAEGWVTLEQRYLEVLARKAQKGD